MATDALATLGAKQGKNGFFRIEKRGTGLYSILVYIYLKYDYHYIFQVPFLLQYCIS